VIARAATEAGIDPGVLRDWTAEDEVEAALRADMRAARSPSPASRAQDYKLGGPPEERRYTCPSYELERTAAGRADWPTADRVDLPGFRPVEAYEAALANIAPELTRRPDPGTVEEVLDWAGMPLATAEVAAVCDRPIIDVREELARELHRPIGIVPELKHSTYFRSEGLPLEEPFVQALRRNHIDDAGGRVTVQSFEVGNLEQLHQLLPGVPLVQLFDAKTRMPGDVLASGGTLTYGQMATPAGLREIASYAAVAGPPKDYIVPRDPATGRSLAPTSFIADAHRAGLAVVAYTFRNENRFLPAELRSDADPNHYGDAIAEYQMCFRLGIDGVFSDNPDTAKIARDEE
jgi:glycerophosphoryl diester phosphodiesterase